MTSAGAAPLMILVAGPYRSGTDGDPAKIQANVDANVEVRRHVHRTPMIDEPAVRLVDSVRAVTGTHDFARELVVPAPVTHISDDLASIAVIHGHWAHIRPDGSRPPR